MMRTLRGRLTWFNLVIVAVALSMFAVLLYVWFARTLYRHHDTDLAVDLESVVVLLSGTTDPGAALESIDSAEMGGPLLVLRNTTGAVLFRSRRIDADDVADGAGEAIEHARATDAGQRFFTVTLGHEPVRFICVPLDGPFPGYLQVGRRLGEVEELLETLAWASGVLVPLVLVLTSFGSFAIARRALAPIEEMASTLESIQAIDLSRRVRTGTADSEITRLSTSVNRLLDRLQASFAAMRDFTAEVSHQLKTPLAVMKGAVEAAVRDGGAERLGGTLNELSADIDALTATIGDLRTYALTEAESAPTGAKPINVSEVFTEAAEVIRALAESNDLTCDVHIEDDLFTHGNAVRLRQVLLNLGENAVQFTRGGGSVRIAAWYERTDVVLEISDTGFGLEPTHVSRVFERHFRGRRADGSTGSGLGLAIAKRIVDAHGGRITLASSLGAGTRVAVKLPAADSSTGR